MDMHNHCSIARRALAVWAFAFAATVRAATFHCDPVHGSADGDGSAARPWRTIEEVLGKGLVQWLDSRGQTVHPQAPVKPGDTVLLHSGWHGSIRIASAFNDQTTTLAAAAGNSPHLGWIEIGEGRNWCLKGLTVSPSLAPSPSGAPPKSLVTLGERGGETSANLVVEDCFVYTTLDTSAWSARDWMEKTASGIWLGRHGRTHIARNNYVLNTRFGINLCAADCVAEGNVVDSFSGDGIRATRDGQTVRRNVIKNIFVSSRDGDDNHDDGIQVFLFNKGRGLVSGVAIRENLIVARERDDLPFPAPMQGIGCFDGPLAGFNVSDNVVCVNTWHGLSLYDAQGCVISNNICFTRWPNRERPWIMLGQKQGQARGNTVCDNQAVTFSFKADAEVKAERNQPVTEPEYSRRQAELLARIEAAHGRIHPTAQRPRFTAAPN